MLHRRVSLQIRPRFAAFTLIELLVVIAIIVLLISILLPVLGMARKAGRATNSLANMRSWGQGTFMFLNDSKYMLPWEGEQMDITANYPKAMWWGNAVPPYVGQPPYSRVWLNSVPLGKPVPLPPADNIFIDPAAEIGPEQLGGQPLHKIPYYFSYAWNADLAEGTATPAVIDGLKRIRYESFRKPSKTILMFELRAGCNELNFLDPASPYYFERNEKDLLRMKGDEKHFAGRHMEGGHLAYADGHAAHRKWIESYEAGDWANDASVGD